MNSLLRLFFSIFLLLITSSATAEVVTVTIKNFTFTPKAITINLGDSIKWVNQDTTTHSTTQSANLWTHDLSVGESFNQEFTTPGIFRYYCRFHSSMIGTITVHTAEQSRIKIGQNIVSATSKVLPITLDLAGKNANEVYLGSYIVNAQAGCANCHSCPTYTVGHNPHNGESKQFNVGTYLAGGVVIGGHVSSNLTPDSSGKPVGLTRIEFKKLLRAGHDPDMAGMPGMEGGILQIMPWPILGMMSDSDLNAIYAYLSSIPKTQTPTNTCSIGQ